MNKLFLFLFCILMLNCSPERTETEKPELSVDIPTGCQKHVQLRSKVAKGVPTFVDKKFGFTLIEVWKMRTEKPTYLKDVKGRAGYIALGSRAVILKKYGKYYKIQSPYEDKPIGWIHKNYISRTLYQDTKTFKSCRKK